MNSGRDIPCPTIDFEIFRKFPEITAFATIRGEDFSLSRKFPANRKLLAARLEIPSTSLIFLNQIHSDTVIKISAPAESAPEGDASATILKRIALCGLSADCPVVLLYDSKTGAIAAAHSGWRGTAKQIAAKTVQFMGKEFGSEPENIFASIGPGICGKCYEVSGDVAEKILSSCPDSESCKKETKEGKYLINLKSVIRKQLVYAGLKSANVEMSNFCTSCNNDLFFSHRKEKPERGQFAVIIMRK